MQRMRNEICGDSVANVKTIATTSNIEKISSHFLKPFFE